MIERLLQSICQFSNNYNSSTRLVRSSDLMGVRLVSTMMQLKKVLEVTVGTPEFFEWSISKGASNIPRVLWVGCHRRGGGVSSGLSATLCFGKGGNGVVAGVMEPVGMRSGLAVLVNRTQAGMIVDVDGPNRSTKYNNRFINPSEFSVHPFDEQAFVGHLKVSVQLLDQLVFRRNRG